MSKRRHAEEFVRAIAGRVLPVSTTIVLAITGCAVGEDEFGAEEGDSGEPDEVEESQAGHDSTPVLGEDEALWDQAVFIAKEEGRDVDAVYERLLFEQDVTSYLQQLDESGQLGTSFAGGKFSEDGSPAVTWFFKGEVPKAVRDDVKLRGTNRLALQGGRRYSVAELVAMQDAVHSAVVGMGYRNAYSGFDLESQEVTLEVSDGPAFFGHGGQTRAEAAAAAATRALGKEVGTTDFAIVDVAGPSTTPQHGYGGAWMRLSDGTDWCTSGFVARRTSDGVEGVLTASHCEGLRQIADHGNGFSFSAPWAGEHIGVWGDVEWHTTTHDDFPQFYSSGSARTTVTGRIANNAMQEDASVCLYGRVGGRDCGQVEQINTTATFTWNGQQVTARHMVDARNVDSMNGDSGGPWYSGSVAWGIHHGIRLSNGHAVFSKIQNAEAAFGVRVQTN